MFNFSVGNFVAWMEQAFLLASAGALLPVLFRIRDPRSKLLYCHALLAVIVLLPWIQPLRGASATNFGWVGAANGGLILKLLIAGAAVKLCWLLAGLWRIRRDRIASMPLYPIPEPVRAASAVTQTDALFCISPGVAGPVMLGWLTPVVLLPESFLSLGEEAQCGIACHELLHVRRHDWLITVLEELAGTLLWLNPAIWPLLAQARLAREQLVDAEVVRLTASPESYIEALLAIARGRRGVGLDLAPAPLFLRKRHLTQRVHLLLKGDVLNEGSGSGVRLALSYVSIALLLGLTGWFGAASFPLVAKSVPQPTVAAVLPAHSEAQAQAPAKAAAPASIVPAETAAPSPDDAEPAVSQSSMYPSAPVPADPHELVTGPVWVIESSADQAAALQRIRQALQKIKPRQGALARARLDVSFTSAGAGPQAGSGHFTQIWSFNQNSRWTVNFGDYALDRIVSGGRTVESPSVSAIPMRVHDLFATFPSRLAEPTLGSHIRSAAASWKGMRVTCLLTSGVRGRAAYTQGRLWEEREYCIDAASGLLQVYSVAPGTFTVFSYDRELQFRGQLVPDRVTNYTAGSATIDAQFAFAEASPAELSLLTPPPEMTPISVNTGNVSRFPVDTPHPFASSGLIQPVIVHAEIGRDGAVMEEEVSSAADPALAQAALDVVKQTPFAADGMTQQQAYINVRFQPAK